MCDSMTVISDGGDIARVFVQGIRKLVEGIRHYGGCMAMQMTVDAKQDGSVRAGLGGWRRRWRVVIFIDDGIVDGMVHGARRARRAQTKFKTFRGGSQSVLKGLVVI